MESWGDGTPPLVLLHEGLGSVAGWRSFPRELARAVGRRVIAYSRAGHGASDPPALPRTRRFMHEEAIEWLPRILDQAGVDDPRCLVTAMAAQSPLIFAATYPSRTDALILEAPHVRRGRVDRQYRADTRRIAINQNRHCRLFGRS
jgi:pimeloyl-ACP methyl ester carboxylesterase